MSMRRVLLRISHLIGVGLLAISVSAGEATADDQKSILAILDVFEQAFEMRDAKLYASNFSADAHWENAFGGRERGREAIEERLTGVYKMFQQADQKILDRHVQFIASDVAVAVLTKDIYGQRSAASGTALSPRRVRNTSVLRKTNGKWEVVFFEAADIRTDNLPSR